MPRGFRPSKKDTTQKPTEIALRRAGWAVLDTSALGRGAPDLFASKAGTTVAVEVKSPGGKRRPGQVEWAHEWKGMYMTGDNPLEIVEMLERML